MTTVFLRDILLDQIILIWTSSAFEKEAFRDVSH